MLAIVTSIGVLAGLAFLLTSLIILASRKFAVYEDRRIAVVDAMLPQNNCGGCGFPSCHAFAEALVNTQVLPGKCVVSSDAERAAIAAFLSVDVGAGVRQVARLACAGGTNVAVNKAHYHGVKSCIAAAQVSGGPKACMWGCVGFGDCASACTFDAIQMNAHGLPVIDVNKCTACGDCVRECPKTLLSLQSVDHYLWVACKNEEMGETVLSSCKVGCTACGRCAADAPENIISMRHNLPKIDYDKNLDGRNAIERCPTGAIVWIEEDGEVKHGGEAGSIVRQAELPTVAS